MTSFEDIIQSHEHASPQVISLLGEVFNGVPDQSTEPFQTQTSTVESKSEDNSAEEDKCEKYSIGILNVTVLTFICFVLLNITNLSIITTRITNKFIMCFLQTLLIVSMFWLYVKFTV